MLSLLHIPIAPNIVRLAMYTDEGGGYCTDGNKDNLKKVEINRERARAYRENPPADYKARQSESFKRWYQKNRRRVIKHVCEHRKEYWWRNHERMLEYAREYYQKNRELITLNRRINYYDKCVASYYKEE